MKAAEIQYSEGFIMCYYVAFMAQIKTVIPILKYTQCVSISCGIRANVRENIYKGAECIHLRE